MRPVAQMKHAAMAYPIQTQSQDCHHDRPAETIEDEIIQVLMLKLSAIQKPTKFHAFHWRLAGSTGFRSWLVSISRDVLRPGSWSTASLSAHVLRRAPLSVAMAGCWTVVVNWCSSGCRQELPRWADGCVSSGRGHEMSQASEC